MKMTIAEIKAELEKIETRAAEISTQVETAEGEDLEKLQAEIEETEKRKAELTADLKEAEERAKDVDDLESGKAKEAREVTLPKEKAKMDIKEIRASKEYSDAFAAYIRTGKDAECRKLLTEISDGGVPVPVFVDDVIRHAWETDAIMSTVGRTEQKGIIKVGFEMTAGEASIHKEGGAAVTEEELALGIVTMVPETIKKWISFSDETQDYENSEGFLTYIYDELTHKILKKAADEVVAAIVAAPEASTATAPAVAKVASTGIMDFENAAAQLSDEALNPVIIMNRKSKPYYEGLAQASNYAYDPFRGMTVLYNNTLAVADGTTTGTYAIVGDLANGARVNCPNGITPTFKYDDVTQATEDLVKVIGRMPAAIAVIAPFAFAKIVKE